MTRRSRAREVALQVLYQSEVNPGVVAADLERFLVGRLRLPMLVTFAQLLIEGVGSHCGQLDALLELLHTDVTGPVAVDEAIELARRYGSDASARFVSGILGKLLADRDAATAGRISAEVV